MAGHARRDSLRRSAGRTGGKRKDRDEDVIIPDFKNLDSHVALRGNRLVPQTPNPKSQRPHIVLSIQTLRDHVKETYSVVSRLGSTKTSRVDKVRHRKDVSSTESLDAVIQEYLIGRKASHPHLVKYYQKWSINEKPCFFLIEYCDAGSLDNYCLNPESRQTLFQGMTESSLLRHLFLDTFEGLYYLHTKGFLHLDVKPVVDNIFLVPTDINSGQTLLAKLGDFGTCWRLGDTSFEEREGDGYYAAPELVQHSLNSRVTPDTHADIFSLGMTMLGVGMRMALSMDVWTRVLQRDIPSLDFTSEFSALIRSMLEPDLRYRPSSTYLSQSPALHQLAASVNRIIFQGMESAQDHLNTSLESLEEDVGDGFHDEDFEVSERTPKKRRRSAPAKQDLFQKFSNAS